MNDLFKKTSVFLFIALILMLLGNVSFVDAKPANVSDCIDGSKDCTELEDFKTKNPKSNDVNQSNDEEKEKTDEIGESTGSLILSLIKMVVALTIILIMIYGLLKFLNKRNKSYQKLASLENVGGISLGQNKSIQMIRVGNKVYLIGVGENVEMLQEVDDPALKDEILLQGEERQNKDTIIDQLMNFKKGDKNSTSPDFKNLFKAELTKLQSNRKQIIKERTEGDEEHE